MSYLSGRTSLSYCKRSWTGYRLRQIELSTLLTHLESVKDGVKLLYEMT